ncbi:MAG: methyl-accepting chemotaxis protein, partial [Pseudomonadota bacterium]
MSSLSIKAKILSLAVVSVIGFLISLTVNSNINSANSDRLQMIQKTFFPVVQDSKANLVRLEQIKELFSTAVSAGEMDFVNTAEKISKQVTGSLDMLERIWPQKSAETQAIRKAFAGYYQAAKKLSVGMLDGSLDPGNMPSLVQQM